MLFGLPLDTIAFLWLGALVGGIAAGGSGFAFGLAASSIWLHRIDPLHSTILITGCGVLLHLTTIWPQRRNIQIGKLWPVVAGGLPGIPIGVYLLTYTDGGVLKTVLGIFLVVFGTYALLAPRLPVISAGGRTADAARRLHRRHSGRHRRLFRRSADDLDAVARLAQGNRARRLPALRNHHTSRHVSGYSVGDAFDRTGLFLLIVVLPPLLLGTWIGWQLYGRLDERRFRQALAVLLIASGATLVL